ncbi:membrane or secreted protein [Roseimaritima sediminicola]|uniref:membrane or secreted protein n=1 Tax=Roseimaritima sediminicola TaxID=2662066 RepID=UPI0012985069|nr:membrane or secreted protein [Roseimaritima sediminicola]
MLPNLSYLLGALTLVVALPNAFASAQAADPPAAAEGSFVSAVELLPETTGGYLRVLDLPAACEAWERTTLSNLGTAPVMQPFWEAQEESADRQLEAGGLKIGLRITDLYDISSGEVLLGWMSYPDPKRPFTACLITDIRGRQARAEQALATLDENMKSRKATRRDVAHQGQTIRVYTLPKAPGQFKLEQIAVTIGDQRLIASDRDATIKQLLDAVAAGGAQGGLARAKDHTAIWEKVGQSEPDEVQWFVRPLDFARIMREVAGTDRGQRVDIVQLLENQGFDAIQSTGGRVQLAEGDFDLLHHGFVYAPQDPASESRFRLAARMLAFPNTPASDPPAWLATETSTWARLSWQMEDAFWAAETLVDEAFGSEIFRPTLAGIKEDEEGPQIDIPNDVIGHFDNELFHITDNIDADNDRTLVAIRLKDTGPVAAAINKAMESEPDASPVEKSPEHPIWKVVPNTESDFDEEAFGEFGFDDDFGDEDTEDQPAPLLEQWAITVIQDPAAGASGGYLMFSSHTDQLVETVNRIRSGEDGRFASQDAVRRVLRQIQQLGGDSRAMANVDRTRLSWRTKYQLLREGTLKDSDSILGNLIRRVQERRKDGAENPELNTGKLPPFSEIEGFLNPGGGYMKTEADGWRLRNFLLK